MVASWTARSSGRDQDSASAVATPSGRSACGRGRCERSGGQLIRLLPVLGPVTVGPGSPTRAFRVYPGLRLPANLSRNADWLDDSDIHEHGDYHDYDAYDRHNGVPSLISVRQDVVRGQ